MTRSGRACCAPARAAAAVRDELAIASGPVDRSGMALIPGGTFVMGGDDVDGVPSDGEGPVREVSLSSYLIDATAVSNREFAAFVAATGYVTDAERFGWSFVFYALLDGKARSAARQGVVPDAPWWLGVDGACWRAPHGPASSADDYPDHPVVQVTFRDAKSYAAWRGKRLPTEAEWEKAARGGLQQAKYPWGDELRPNGEHRCNIWQGRFPEVNTGDDGYLGTAPVDAFAANGHGLYNMSGNVWEWCADAWSTPGSPPSSDERVIRGGSYLCHASYCNRYRVAARTYNNTDSSTGHMGFRCAADVAG